MWCNQIFSLIQEETIKNIIVADNYEIANQLARMQYGDEAYAVDTTQYPVGIGYKHIDGVFYDEDEVAINQNPNESQNIALLQDKIQVLESSNIETELDIDYRLSMIELGLA
jgi:hypothetical protein